MKIYLAVVKTTKFGPVLSIVCNPFLKKDITTTTCQEFSQILSKLISKKHKAYIVFEKDTPSDIDFKIIELIKKGMFDVSLFLISKNATRWEARRHGIHRIFRVPAAFTTFLNKFIAWPR